jgi:elongation factor G
VSTISLLLHACRDQIVRYCRPGHVDFTIEVERSLRVLDGAVAVFDGVAGVESQTETVWRQANEYRVPRICFINKLDRMGANFYMCVDMIRKQLQAVPLVTQLPIGAESEFIGVIDLVANTAIIWSTEELGARYTVQNLDEAPISAELKAKAAKYRATLIEQAVEQDEALLMEFLDGKEPSIADLKRCIRKGTLNFSFVPIVTGSAFKNKGVQTLLDAVVDYLPSPLDRPPVQGTAEHNSSIPLERPASDSAPMSALAFKIMNDPFVGTLTFVRVYSGVLSAGTQLRNTAKGKMERVGRMLQMHANERTDVKEARSCDIVALAGLKDTVTGDTLCNVPTTGGPNTGIVLERIRFPSPVIKLALEPKTKSDQENMGQALSRLAREDPSLRYNKNEGSGQTTIEGMGELHLDIVVDRLRREYNVECIVGEPQVAYKETITRTALIDYTHKKQSGGAGQFARVKIEFTPLFANEGSDSGTDNGENDDDLKVLEFVNEIKGGAIPKEYIPAVEKGIEAVLHSGVLAGFPVIGVRAVLLDGAFHDVDSSTLAFELAAKAATREGLRKAGSRLKEPIMQVDVSSPEEYLGDVIGDINSRRGQILDLGDRGMSRTVAASVPLSNMFQYVSTLRSMSKGRASYSMELNGYSFVPPNVEKDVITKYGSGATPTESE